MNGSDVNHLKKQLTERLMALILLQYVQKKTIRLWHL